MIWFITMCAGVFGLYARGNKWANAPKGDDPVLTEVQALSARFSGLETYMHELDGRISSLEDKAT